MKLPSLDRLVVSESKLTNYLLSETHPIGRTKAQLFKLVGYSTGNSKMLAENLKAIAHENEIAKEERTPFGIRYIIDGVLSTPSGRALPIRTVWFIENIDNDMQIPHFITAYPR